MKPWKRIEPTVVSKIGWRVIVTKLFEMPDGTVKDWQTIGEEDTQCVETVALTKDNQVIVARTFRPGPERVVDEIPGGFTDTEDKDLESTARRELLEETGYEAGAMTYLGKVLHSAYSNNAHHYFLARDCTLHSAGQKLDDDEFIEVRTIPIDELFENARTGNMTDVSGVFLAYEQLKKIKQGE